MSNYHLMPPFGPAFNPNHNYAIPSGGVQPGIPRYPYQQSQDSNSIHQAPSNGTPSLQRANAYAFNVNAQNLKSGASGNGAPPSPFPGLGQLPNGSLPPPPFPPVPISQFASYAQPPSKQYNSLSTLRTMQPHVSLPAKPPDQSLETSGLASQDSRQVVGVSTDREDGELSDGESSKQTKETSAHVPSTIEPSTRNHSQISQLQASDHHQKRVTSSPDPHLKANHPSSSETTPRYSTTEHFQQNLQGFSPQSRNHSQLDMLPRKRRNAHDGGLEYQHTQRESNGTVLDHQATILSDGHSMQARQNGLATDNELRQDLSKSSSSRPHNPPTERSLFDTRNLAKNALRELYPNIGFVALVEEGIEPALLRELYSEIGIDIESQTQTNEVANLKTPNEGINVTLKLHPPNNEVGFSGNLDQVQESTQTHEKPSSLSTSLTVGTKVPSIPRSLNGELKIPVENGSGSARIPAQTASQDLQVIAAAAVMAPRTSKPSGTNLVSRSTTVRAGDKSLERKDYIARMLAAKAGKPIPTAMTPQSSRPPAEIESKMEAIPSSLTADSRDVTSEGKDSLTGNLDLMTSDLDGKTSLRRAANTQKDLKAEGAAATPDVFAESSNQTAKQSLSTGLADTESEKNVQTDLALQKIKLLKHQDGISQRGPQVSNNEQPSFTNQHFSPEELPSNVLDLQNRVGTVHQRPDSWEGPLHLPQSLTTTRTNAPLRIGQSSNCGPTSRTPSFTIPGLFMVSAPLVSTASNNASTTQSSTAALHIDLQEQAGLSPLGAAVQDDQSPSHSIMVPVFARSGETSDVIMSEESTSLAMPSIEMPSETRKRKRAVDFIESPAVKIKRPLGQNEDTSVIIEISEDEATDESDEDHLDMNIEQGPVVTHINATEANADKKKLPRDLPPLSDFPTRKKPATMSAFGTPPAIQTPGKGKEQEDLKFKEEQIQLMNRKIAELEQRRKAKQTTSRAQTPGTPGHHRSTPNRDMTPVEITEQQKTTTDIERSIDAANEQLRSQTITLLASKTVENSMQERIFADKQATDRRIAEAAEANRQNELLKEQHERDRKQAEAAEAVRQEQIHMQQQEKEKYRELAEAVEIAKQQQLVLAQQAKDHELAKAAEAALKERLLAEQRVREETLLKAETERVQAEEAATAAEVEQRRRRRVEIESGLPILDAEVARTRQNLQVLRQEIENLEAEVQKGVEGRRVLLAELDGLTDYMKELPNGMAISIVHENVNQSRRSLGDKQEPFEPIDVVQNEKLANDGNLSPAPPHHESRVSPTPSTFSVTQMSSAKDVGEENMDISRSDLDEGEFTDYSPEPPTHNPAAIGPSDTSDLYEAPKAFQINPHLGVDDSQPKARPTANAQALDPAKLLLVTDDVNDNLGASEEPEAVYEASAGADAQVERQRSSRSRSPTDSSDFDYEPPEPTSPVELTTILPDVVITSRAVVSPPAKNNAEEEHPFLPSKNTSDAAEVVDINVLQPANPKIQEDVISSRISKQDHFTPYESPLKLFKSYRYHPDFVPEVSGGFRSLTYSHSINPSMPVCRYEAAGGICNDNSCDSQHFRSMILSDDKVLVQMGSQPKGLSTAEGDAYVTGLKQVISEIRSRKVKNFDTVASEITAYRSQFLGDKSKVLNM